MAITTVLEIICAHWHRAVSMNRPYYLKLPTDATHLSALCVIKPSSLSQLLFINERRLGKTYIFYSYCISKRYRLLQYEWVQSQISLCGIRG